MYNLGFLRSITYHSNFFIWNTDLNKSCVHHERIDEKPEDRMMR